ncbi:hypothetical protein N7G274_003488 [Stereocaulon virgatum]|uniref:Zinc finger C3HC4 RING-type domain-containing protein n=1 Tax=Stereocaulon virgatum TaxID=373712 RepID=A0ABR4AFV2_9LECA
MPTKKPPSASNGSFRSDIGKGASSAAPQTANHAPHTPATRSQTILSSWYCCRCNHGPLSIETDPSCINLIYGRPCGHRRCYFCGLDANPVVPEPAVFTGSERA